MRQIVFLASIAIVTLAVGAAGQESRSEIAIQGTGLFTKQSAGEDANGAAVTATADNTGGFLFSYRYRLSRWLAAEGSYGLAHDGFHYATAYGSYNGTGYAHQATGNFVMKLASDARWKFSPYLLLGAGALIFSPPASGFLVTGDSQRQVAGTRQSKGAFVYGAGADFVLTKRFSLRAEYRGLIYHAPNFGVSSFVTGSITHRAQPSAGLVFRF
jgi:opacity protein-like surface antigen